MSSVSYDNEVQSISGFFDFTIIPTADICEKIAPDLLNYIDEIFARSPITLTLSAGKVGYVSASYEKQINEVTEALLQYDSRLEQCVKDLKVEFKQSDVKDLSHNAEQRSLTLFSNTKTEPGTHQDAKLVIKLASNKWKIPIKVEFNECRVLSWSLSQYSLAFRYQIGKEAMQIRMPEVTQIPDCGKTVPSFEIAHWVSSRLTLANFKATVSLDQELNVLSVWSDDISL